jgi:hypothetical protein
MPHMELLSRDIGALIAEEVDVFDNLHVYFNFPAVSFLPELKKVVDRFDVKPERDMWGCCGKGQHVKRQTCQVPRCLDVGFARMLCNDGVGVFGEA